jgi:hypothetical protein
MYVRRFTAFPKAQFDFSLVTWIGSRMEELLTGGDIRCIFNLHRSIQTNKRKFI